MNSRQLAQATFAIFLVLLLQNQSSAWIQRSVLRSPTRIPYRLEQQHLFDRNRIVRHLSHTNVDGELIDYDENKDSVIESRRRWLGSVGAMAAAATGFSVVPLPSNADATLVSSKSVCDATVSVWSKNGRIIYLLGTAHISKTSAELAGQLVRDTNPKGVFIELDPKRVSGTGALAEKFRGDENTPAPPRESKTIIPVISEVPGDGGMVLVSGPPPSSSSSSSLSIGEPSPAPVPAAKPKKVDNNPVMKAATAAVGKQLKGLYSRLDSAGFDSGDEFVTAVREGKKLGADIVLGDRDVEITLRRITEGLAKTDIKALLSPDSELEKTLESMVPANAAMGERLAGGSSSEMTDAQFKEELTTFVEAMKTKENVTKIMGQLKRVAPFLYEALVSERDVYMATGLNGLNELETIVAVVGIAHADGIESTLQQNGWKAAIPACQK